MQRDLTVEERRTRFDKQTLDTISQLVAVRQKKILGAIYWQIEANRTVMIWLPQCDLELGPEDAEAVSLALLDGVLQQARRADANLIQAALYDGFAERDREVLQKSGYEYLADLLYLASTTETMPSELPSSELEFEPYEETEYERLTKLVETTYEGTLDCPTLNGVQSIDTVLEGYRKVGRFLPQHWRFVRHQGQDVGCLLMAEHPPQELFELVYMGLIPGARGKGWGYQISRFAQWLTQAANRTHLVVAVDAANRPAVSGYERAGFIPWDRRVVYVKVL